MNGITTNAIGNDTSNIGAIASAKKGGNATAAAKIITARSTFERARLTVIGGLLFAGSS